MNREILVDFPAKPMQYRVAVYTDGTAEILNNNNTIVFRVHYEVKDSTVVWHLTDHNMRANMPEYMTKDTLKAYVERMLLE